MMYFKEAATSLNVMNYANHFAIIRREDSKYGQHDKVAT